MAQLLVLSSAPGGGAALPALELLSHRVRQIPAEAAQLINAPSADVIFIDARFDLVGAKSLCKIMTTTGVEAPLVLIVTEGGLTAVSTDWGIDDVVLAGAGPAEIDARIRLAMGRRAADQVSTRIQTSGITIDESSYSAKVHGKPLDLTYKEFQLLHFFATHPPACSRASSCSARCGGTTTSAAPHGGRPRPAPARQARRSRAAHRHGPQRRLPLQRVRGRGAGDGIRPRLTTRAPAVHARVTDPCNDVGMMEHDALDAGLGDADDDDFDEAVEADDDQLPDHRYLDRELSWLAFNQRVLELAEDPAVPVLERANFLAIFASNLDEFFMVRVAGLKRRIVTGLAVPTNVGRAPLDVLADISAEAHRLQLRHAAAWTEKVRPALAESGIEVVTWDSLDAATAERLTEYFQRNVFPVLMPLAVDPAHPFPYISGLSLNLAIRIRNARTGRQEFARLKVPPMLPRFVEVPGDGPGVRYLPLEELISNHLGDLFPGMEVLDHHAFRLTRNEDMTIEEDETENLIQALEAELLRRRFGPPIRLEITEDMDDVTRALLLSELDITEQEVYRLPGSLDLRGLFDLSRIDRPDLHYPPHVPKTALAFQPPEQNGRADLFGAIRKGDVLVHHPYESFATSVQAFLEQAARDPHVLAIKQTLYRTSGDSPIVQALIDAAEAGKQVLALVEVKARFDEANNIVWARKLEKAGVHVVYGLVGLKTHCKLALVIREEEGRLRHYSHVGTGNYNPKTSRIYEDFGLFTVDDQVGRDLTRLFNELSGYAIEKKFKRLLVAPLHLRKGLLRHIDKERQNALAGKPSGVRIKVNSMVDEQIIDALYRASQAGVPVEVWVRGICSIKPGVPGMSENITVRSILGRYLEHSRIFTFVNDGDPQVFIGSADMMHRNLDRRVEALVRVVDENQVRELTSLFDFAMDDATSSWHLGSEGEWVRHSVAADGTALVDLQDRTMALVQRKRRARTAR